MIISPYQMVRPNILRLKCLPIQATILLSQKKIKVWSSDPGMCLTFPRPAPPPSLCRERRPLPLLTARGEDSTSKRIHQRCLPLPQHAAIHSLVRAIHSGSGFKGFSSQVVYTGKVGSLPFVIHMIHASQCKKETFHKWL